MNEATYTAKMIQVASLSIQDWVRKCIPGTCAEVTAEAIRITNIPSATQDIDIEITIRKAGESLGIVYGDGELTIRDFNRDDSTAAGLMADPGKEATLKI